MFIESNSVSLINNLSVPEKKKCNLRVSDENNYGLRKKIANQPSDDLSSCRAAVTCSRTSSILFFFCERMRISLDLDNSTSPPQIQQQPGNKRKKQKSTRASLQIIVASRFFSVHREVASNCRSPPPNCSSPPTAASSCCHHQSEPTHVEPQEPTTQMH